jgi:hypothetical protein
MGFPGQTEARKASKQRCGMGKMRKKSVDTWQPQERGVQLEAQGSGCQSCCLGPWGQQRLPPCPSQIMNMYPVALATPVAPPSQVQAAALAQWHWWVRDPGHGCVGPAYLAQDGGGIVQHIPASLSLRFLARCWFSESCQSIGGRVPWF